MYFAFSPLFDLAQRVSSPPRCRVIWFHDGVLILIPSFRTRGSVVEPTFGAPVYDGFEPLVSLHQKEYTISATGLQVGECMVMYYMYPVVYITAYLGHSFPKPTRGPLM